MVSATEDPPVRRRIALIAHDNKKEDLRDWAAFNYGEHAMRYRAASAAKRVA